MYNVKKIFVVSMLTCLILVSLTACARNSQYDGRVSSKDAEETTNALMVQILDALNAKDKEKFISLFSKPVRDATPELDAMADEVMKFYQGTGAITDDSYFGERGHNDHGMHSCFGSNLYSVDTDVKSYRIAIGNYVTNAFDRNMEGLFVFQIWEEGYATGKLVRVGIESDGGVYIYHCNTTKELEELPHRIIANDKMIKVSDLPDKRRETEDIVKEDANVNLIKEYPYIDYYDEVAISYNWEFDTNAGIHHIYRFDLQTMEMIDHESYSVTHPEYID